MSLSHRKTQIASDMSIILINDINMWHFVRTQVATP